MIEKPIDVLHRYEIRKTKKQKAAFRQAAMAYVTSLGYICNEEKGSMGAVNLVIGDPEKAKYLVTAHYDTCPRLPFPNLITPCNFWTFLAYQLFMVFVMLLPPVLPGLAVVWITQDPDWFMLAWYVSFWVAFLLMFAGPANKHTANDNTSGVVTVLELAASFPEEKRGDVCFVLFDLEESGLIGSASYRKTHKKETNDQLVLNLDCVGDGDELVLFPTKKLKKNQEKMAFLEKMSVQLGHKSLTLHNKGFSVYPSDQNNFPYGVGVAAFHRCKIGLYCGRIHTPRDTVLEADNVHLLRDRLLKLLTKQEMPDEVPVA